MMLCQLKQSHPVQAKAEDMLDSGRQPPVPVFAAASQNQVKFRVERDGVRRV